ncbi:MAG: hypothetical protein WBW69_15980, partial [Candidatus Korobacteraceae bacterium]
MEFTSRSARKNASERSAESAREAIPSQPSSGSVPPVARAARDAAAPRAFADLESQQFTPEESLAELRELTTSAGAAIAGEILQRRQKPDPATLIGSGKVEELKGA